MYKTSLQCLHLGSDFIVVKLPDSARNEIRARLEFKKHGLKGSISKLLCLLSSIPETKKPVMIRICVVENEEKVAAFIKKGLEENGYKVDLAEETSIAEKLLEAKSYDLLLLDIMLPGVSGTSFCQKLRQENNHIPVLMLTALGTIDDKVNGLKSGADDYLVKPFRFAELLARIEALIRRQTTYVNSPFLTFEGLVLDTWEKTAQRENIKISLTAKEYLLLELFMKNPSKLLTRQYIAEQVWGIDFDTGTNVIDVYVNYLRNKVDKEFDTKLIHTIVGMGYIMKSADEN